MPPHGIVVHRFVSWLAECLHWTVQPPPGTFGGTLGLGGADGFGGTGENNVMYAGQCAFFVRVAL